MHLNSIKQNKYLGKQFDETDTDSGLDNPYLHQELIRRLGDEVDFYRIWLEFEQKPRHATSGTCRQSSRPIRTTSKL